ncbi:MAG: hypothetical protein DLM58_08670 [Pseudonocardiales bacterium]|nr:MAG: hypothetical protein DLM58_08670 [Pseudonocardiales bacterium]
MLPVLVLSALVLLVAFGYLIERQGYRHRAQPEAPALLEQKHKACAASYLRESIATSLVHDPHHPGYSGRRR